MASGTRNPERETRNTGKLPPAVFLLGPTTSGKTGVAVDIVRELPCEIISVDSAQVYRHMDIGTAKPPPEILEVAPHHLIDIIEPDEAYSAAGFRRDALALMGQITRRGKIPLLVGGTMLYFKALAEGLSELPEADAAVRAVIEALAQDAGWPALHQELARLDPASAARIEPADAQRIQRALEICYVTGKPMSEMLRERQAEPLPYRVTALALIPGERAELHRRIARRFEDMLELGLIGEVERLRRKFDLDLSMPSMRCVGYRQVWRYLEGEYGLAALREKGVAATRQLAKRQLTWLRSMAGLEVLDCLAENLSEQALRKINLLVRE